MFGIGFFELVVIAIVALVFVGPKRLPEVMKQAGRFFVQMRRTATDVRSTFDQVIHQAEEEIRREEADHLRNLLTGGAKQQKTTAAAATTLDTQSQDVVRDGHLAHDHLHDAVDEHAHDTHRDVEKAPAAASGGGSEAALAAPEGAKPYSPIAEPTQHPGSTPQAPVLSESDAKKDS